jgi:LETM1 and EF-hand domain-containing protein 1
VTPEEVAAAANYLKDTIGTEGVQELISNLSKDKGAYIQPYCIILVKRIWHIFCSAISLSLLCLCLAEGNILVEDIVKLASQTEENNGHKEVPR